MKITTHFLHLEHTPALDQKIAEASKRLEKFCEGKGTLKWHLSVKSGDHQAEVSYHAPSSDYHATATTDSMYSSIDLAVDKIERQALKHKEKHNKLHKENPDLVILDPEAAWTDKPDAN